MNIDTVGYKAAQEIDGQAEITKNLDKMYKDDNIFPVTWLTFVFLGPPAGPPPLRRMSFSNGHYNINNGATQVNVNSTAGDASSSNSCAKSDPLLLIMQWPWEVTRNARKYNICL